MRLLSVILALIATSSVLPQKKETGTQPILFIFDASGSMAEPFQGTTRMTAARVLLSEQIQKLPLGTRVGLVAYGNGIPGCESYRMYAPLAKSSTSAILAQIGKMVSAGETPIAATLRQVGRTILAKEKNVRIVLISDGQESCGGDPVAEATILRSRGINIHVIGLGVDAITAHSLAAIAGAASGRYYDVHSNSDFVEAIAMSINPESSEKGNPGQWDDKDASLVIRPGKDKPDSTKTEIKKTESESADVFKEGLVITGIRRTEMADSRVRLEVDYKFNWSPVSDYMVIMKLKSTEEGLRQAGSAPQAIATDTHHGTKSDHGTITIELDRVRLPLIVQGELWDISEVPVKVHQSESAGR